MLNLLLFLIIFIVIGFLLILFRVIFTIIKGIFIIRRSMKSNKDRAYTYENYNDYTDGKTIELTKDQYKVE